MEARTDVSAQIAMLGEQLTKMNQQLAYLADKQRQRDELLEEMQPIVKAAMGHATGRLQGLEERGYFTFLRESLRVVDRVVESYDKDDVRALGDNIVLIMDTVRAYTQPQFLALANEATEVIDHADELEPTGIVGMVRATRDEDVQRGMAVFLGLLRSIGRGLKEAQSSDVARKPQRVRAAASPPAASVVRREAAAPPAAAAQPGPVVIDGVGFDAQGYLADPGQWSPELAVTLAASYGITALSEEHWAVLTAARNDFLENGLSPNIRRLTKIAGITTKALYTLFPKAPGMTVARIAGIPKPAGCI